MRAPILIAALLLASVCLAQPRPARNRPLRDIEREEYNADAQRRELQRLVDEGKKIAVRWQKTPRDEYEFICENHTFSDYSIEVSFPELTNLQADFPLPAVVEVAPGTHTMFIMRKSAAGRAAHFRYLYHYYKGRPSPKIDTGFTYLLPIAPGNDTRVFELSYIGEKYGGEAGPKDWYALSLHTEAGDTVFAARRGRVTDVRDGAKLQDSNYSYAHAENFIEIEHSDYTFAKYSVLKDGALFVHPGDFVEAGQPLGIVGGEKYAGGPQVRFSVFYQLRQAVVDKEGNNMDRTQNWAYVPVSFWTKQQGRTHLANRSTYTCEDPEELITKEMTKKEARKWKEAHKAG